MKKTKVTTRSDLLQGPGACAGIPEAASGEAMSPVSCWGLLQPQAASVSPEFAHHPHPGNHVRWARGRSRLWLGRLEAGDQGHVIPWRLSGWSPSR